jgi:hypothetical protein
MEEGACFTADDGDERRHGSFCGDWKKMEQGEGCWLYSGGKTGEGLEACLHQRRSTELADRLDCSAI